jgi:hypothetical protein
MSSVYRAETLIILSHSPSYAFVNGKFDFVFWNQDAADCGADYRGCASKLRGAPNGVKPT